MVIVRQSIIKKKKKKIHWFEQGRTKELSFFEAAQSQTRGDQTELGFFAMNQNNWEYKNKNKNKNVLFWKETPFNNYNKYNLKWTHRY